MKCHKCNGTKNMSMMGGWYPCDACPDEPVDKAVDVAIGGGTPMDSDLHVPTKPVYKNGGMIEHPILSQFKKDQPLPGEYAGEALMCRTISRETIDDITTMTFEYVLPRTVDGVDVWMVSRENLSSRSTEAGGEEMIKDTFRPVLMAIPFLSRDEAVAEFDKREKEQGNPSPNPAIDEILAGGLLKEGFSLFYYDSGKIKKPSPEYMARSAEYITKWNNDKRHPILSQFLPKDEDYNNFGKGINLPGKYAGKASKWRNISSTGTPSNGRSQIFEYVFPRIVDGIDVWVFTREETTSYYSGKISGPNNILWAIPFLSIEEAEAHFVKLGKQQEFDKQNELRKSAKTVDFTQFNTGLLPPTSDVKIMKMLYDKNKEGLNKMKERTKS